MRNLSAQSWPLSSHMAATLVHTPCRSSPRPLPIHRSKKVTDWQLTEEAQRQALAQLVNAISRLDVTQAWGEGKPQAVMVSVFD